MRVFEAIVRNSELAAGGSAAVPIEETDDLPVVVLTCIDPRLNRLLPSVLGLSGPQFIWLRNAGNIIFDPMSSMMRTLALGCAVKGGKEIAVIGHTDCQIGRTSVADLTERFRKLGVERSRMPDNLTEFFGLFASERQNVLRGAQIIRSSPLIGPGTRVHGLLLDLASRRLEWVINGYETPVDLPAVNPDNRATQSLEAAGVELIPFAPFAFGEMKFPDFKIGETVPAPRAASPASIAMEPIVAPISESTAPRGVGRAPTPSDYAKSVSPLDQAKRAILDLDAKTLFKIIGDDNAVYGPVSGRTLLEWLADGRIDGATLAQHVGYREGKEWRPLSLFGRKSPPEIPAAPPLTVGYEPGSPGKRK